MTSEPSESTWLVYVYAVADGPVDTTFGGIDLMPLRWVCSAGLCAAVSDVPAAEFAEEPLNANVTDMDWLGPRAVAHQEVNAHLHRITTAAIPLSFGTVFQDDGRVSEFLATNTASLRTRLDRVRDASEWVLSLHQTAPLSLDDLERRSPVLRAARAELASSPPGRAHLLRRRLAEHERDERRRLESDTAAAALDLLRPVSRDAFVEPLPRDTADRPLLRASLLVARADEVRFEDACERLRARWPEPTYTVALTGPWPPYRFGGLEPDATAAGASA